MVRIAEVSNAKRSKPAKNGATTRRRASKPSTNGAASHKVVNDRISRLRDQLAERSLDGVLITHIAHVRYLTGFSGSAGVLLVSQDDVAFITDFRYQAQIASELHTGVRGIIDRAPFDRMKADNLVSEGMRIGYQENNLSVGGFDAIKRKLRKVRFERVGGLVADLVAIKTPAEIAMIRKASSITARVFTEILEFITPGMRESEIAAEISYRGRKQGAEADAFEVIVASGPRGALPHGRASNRRIRKGELVTLDFGFRHDGFNSDMTRTFAVGKPSEEARRIYEIVLRAETMGIAAARAGMTGKQLDDVCRDVITAAGFGEQFGHSTGHGLGIDVHEVPHVAAKGAEHVLAENMVVTIEPGIYLPGKLGVRIEDDVVIGIDRSRSLTTSPKDLIIV